MTIHWKGRKQAERRTDKVNISIDLGRLFYSIRGIAIRHSVANIYGNWDKAHTRAIFTAGDSCVAAS